MQTVRGIKVLTAGGLLLSAVATLALAGTASASTPASAVACTHLVGNASTLTANLSGCSAGTGRSGSITSFVPSGGDVTWSNGTTTDYTASYTNSGTLCPAGTEEFNIKGTVSSSTNSSIPVGAVVKMKICSNPTTGKLKNASGTTLKF
ncbi:MAG: hypothetical protein ACLP6E_18120 [Acidimicrobiales bacterium]